MIVPGQPLQTVQVQALPSGYKSVPDANNAPILDAVGQAAQQFGTEAEKRARLLQARQSQTRIFNKSRDAREQVDVRLHAFSGLDGQDALDAGPKLVEGFRKWAEEAGAELDEVDGEIFRQHAEDLALGLSRDIDGQSLRISADMANTSLAGVIQRNTQSGFGVTAAGLVTWTEAPSTEGVTEGEPSTRPSGTLDERPLIERWNTIESGVREWVKTHPGKEFLAAPMLEKARADLYVKAIEGALTPGPHQNHKVAQALLDAHGNELGEQQEQMQKWVTEATYIGSADDAERAIFGVEASNVGTTAERLEAMLERADKAPIPKVLSPDMKETWRDDVKKGLRSRESQLQRDLAAARDTSFMELDQRLQAGEFKSFAELEQSPEYHRLEKEPQLQRALATNWKQKQRGEFTVTKDADYADAVDMLTNPARATEALTYNFKAHPELYSREDADDFDKAQGVAIKAAQEGALKAMDDSRTVMGVVNQRATEFYPGDSDDVDVMTNRGAFVRESMAIERAYRRSHTGNPPPPEWMDTMLGELAAKRTMQVPVSYPVGTRDPQMKAPPWGLEQRTMSGATTEDRSFSILEDTDPEQLNRALEFLLSSGFDQPTGDQILARLVEQELRVDGAGGR